MRFSLIPQDLLSALNPVLRIGTTIMLHHHENADGSGPAGLRSTDIPLVSRIVSVNDAYDAMFAKPMLTARVSPIREPFARLPESDTGTALEAAL